jgi:8-amino-7-oxononanoate synthase
MPERDSLERRVRRRLTELDARGLFRTLRPPTGVDLSSNDYLGLARDPRVVAALMAGAARDGAGSTGSRLLTGERTAFAAVEERFARFKGTDRALYLSSGYLANLAVLTCLVEPGDVIFSDERNHASLIDGMRLSRGRIVVTPHNDLMRLTAILEATPCDGVRFVVVESLYGMDGDTAPLAEYARLCAAFHAVLIVDEAHAVGVCGAQGRGQLEAEGVDANTVISVNTAGKALGVAGAFVAGADWVVDYLLQRARPFVFSTAPVPAVADAIQASLTLVDEEPERRDAVRDRARQLRRRLQAIDITLEDTTSHIVPIVLGDNDRALAVARSLQADGFDVRAIRPPSVPPGTARLRVSVRASLAPETVDRFADALAAVLDRTATSVGA